MYVDLFLCKQKTAYDMRISYWSSDVCASDLILEVRDRPDRHHRAAVRPRLEVGDVRNALAERRVGLRGDAVGAAEQVEIIDECRSQIDLQCLEHPLGRDAARIRLRPVHVRNNTWGTRGDKGETVGGTGG